MTTTLDLAPVGVGTRERAVTLRALRDELIGQGPQIAGYCFVEPHLPARWLIIDQSGGVAIGDVGPLFAGFGRSAALLIGAAARTPLPPSPGAVATRLGIARPNGERLGLLRAAREWLTTPLVSFEVLPPNALRSGLVVAGWLTDQGTLDGPLAALAGPATFSHTPSQLRAAPGDVARRLLFFADAATCRPPGRDGQVRVVLPLDGICEVLAINDQRRRRVRSELSAATDYLRACGYAAGTAVTSGDVCLVRSQGVLEREHNARSDIPTGREGKVRAPVIERRRRSRR